MKVEFKDIDKGFNNLKQEIKRAGNSYTKVGYPVEDEKSYKGKQITTLQVAIIQEFGAPAKKIPARSFVRSYFDGNNKDIQKFADRLYSQVILGRKTTRKALGLLGEYVKAGVQKQIDKVFYPALKPATIKRKKSSKPLIDTGQMRASVTHIEVIKGG
jgi:hypothetical protein